MCECDVPRTAVGWPTVGPEFFNEAQLRKEGEHWRKTALNTRPGTVGYEEWKKYADELHNRGFIEVVDPRVPLLAEDRTFWRNDHERRCGKRRVSIWSIFSGFSAKSA